MPRKIALLATSTLLLAAVAVLTGGAGADAAPAGFVPNSALINGDSVTTSDNITDKGTPISLEQFAAQQAGFKVTVATGAQWTAMTKADFAKYQLLIIGDPFCGTVPASATGNSAVWSSVVMGTSGLNTAVGNRALIGTDPEDHYADGGGNAQPTDPNDPTTAGAEHLVQSGITYAGSVPGATGVYFDTSCSDDGAIQTTMNRLSVKGTGFTLDTSPPCGGAVAQIAKTAAFAKLKDSDIQGWSCSVHITFPTHPTDWQPLAVATDTATHPTCGTDPDTGTRVCGEAYVLIAGKDITATAPDLKLTPAAATDGVGGMHTVTATVTTRGKPATGIKVSFDVTGVNAGVSGTCVPASCVSGSDGTVSFTYRDVNGVGADSISASATIAGSNERATATENWVVVPNRRPVAEDQSVTTPVNTAKDITLVASDPDGDPLTYHVVHQPRHGTLSGSGKNLVYTPDAGYTGVDFFTFTASDGQLSTTEHVVNITVVPPGSSGPPPLAGTGALSRSHLDLGLALLAFGVLLLGLGLVRVPRRRRT